MKFAVRFMFNRCFRLNDLEQGEVIGHGFYGAVYKVSGGVFYRTVAIM